MIVIRFSEMLTRKMWAGLFLLLLFVSLLVCFLLANIHTVIPGKIYRSAQLPSIVFRRLVKLEGIRSELNLRGENAQSAWYQSELSTAKSLGLVHYDVALWKRWEPTRDQMLKLIDVIQQSPKPLLLHCASGADRSGLVSAMALLLQGASLKKARQQISWFYLSATKGTIGPIVLDQYAAWLQSKHWSSTASRFIDWANHIYRA